MKRKNNWLLVDDSTVATSYVNYNLGVKFKFKIVYKGLGKTKKILYFKTKEDYLGFKNFTAYVNGKKIG